MHFPHMNLITGKFFVETLHEERIILQAIGLLELGGNLPRAREQLQVLQLGEVSHSAHLTNWADQDMTIDYRPVVDDGKDVPTAQEGPF